VTLLRQGVGLGDPQRSLPTPNNSVILCEGLGHFGNSAGATHLLTPSLSLTTLCIIVSTNLLHTGFTAHWSGLLWMTWSPETSWDRISHLPVILNKSSQTSLIVQQFHPPQLPGEYRPIPATDNINVVNLHRHLTRRHFSSRQMKAQTELHAFFCCWFSCPKCSFYISILYRSYRLSGKLSASDVTEENL